MGGLLRGTACWLGWLRVASLVHVWVDCCVGQLAGLAGHSCLLFRRDHTRPHIAKNLALLSSVSKNAIFFNIDL
jgi:hypothetical protein